MAEAKRRLTAILAADVAGYSRLMATDEQGTLASLNACRDIFRNEVASHGGRVVDTAGDSVLACFESVVEAVQCAVNVQSELAERNQNLAQDKRMAFRIGVNLGDVIEQDDGTIYGDGVNVAARLQALAEPGGVIVSDDVHRHVSNKLDADFEDAGEHEVKNIAKPVRAYQVIFERMPRRLPLGDVSLSLPDKPSIAVLPFDNLSGDPDQEYFADGIAEDIITALSHDRALFVIARNSTFTYKGKPVNVVQVGQDLGVRYVIEGSVRKADNRERISAQLVDATTGNHLWAERYDRVLEDIFAVQDEITRNVVTTVAPELMSAEMDRIRRKPPENIDAFDYAARAIWHSNQDTQEHFAKAQQFAEMATRLDPKCALGFTALAWCYMRDAIYGRGRFRNQSLALGREAAKQAVELDPADAVAHAMLGQVNLYDRRHSEACRRFEKAIELNPNFAFAHANYSMTLACLGETERALEVIEEALRLSPRDPSKASWLSMGGFAEFVAGRYDEAIEWTLRGQVENPDQPGVLRVMAASYGQAGRLGEARAAVAELRRVAPYITIETTRVQMPFKNAGDLERYLDGLRKGGLPET